MSHDLTPAPDRFTQLDASPEAAEAIARVMAALANAFWDGQQEQISLWIASTSGNVSDSPVLESGNVLNMIFKGAADEPRGKIAP